jgi:hypothetical protein
VVQSAALQQLAFGMQAPLQGLKPALQTKMQPPAEHLPERLPAASSGQSSSVQHIAFGMQDAPHCL